MLPRQVEPRRGFTLIELLVVVAIIALLISILLPALRDAREQAKIAKCLANYRQLMVASTTYFNDNNDRFPFMVTYGTGWMGICSWAYGGKTSSEHWRTDHGGVFWLEARDRPFNAKYLTGGEIDPDVYEGGQLVKRTEIEVLRCPSDQFSGLRNFTSNYELEPISSYDDIGTSYRYNLMALMDVEWNGNRDPWFPPGDWGTRGQQLVRDVLTRHSSVFVMFEEGPMIRGLSNETIEVGNHGKYGKHPYGFLDGHAVYGYTDTRAYCGVGWAAINPSWIKTYGHTPMPAHYYDWIFKNCNPPRE